MTSRAPAKRSRQGAVLRLARGQATAVVFGGCGLLDHPRVCICVRRGCGNRAREEGSGRRDFELAGLSLLPLLCEGKRARSTSSVYLTRKGCLASVISGTRNLNRLLMKMFFTRFFFLKLIIESSSNFECRKMAMPRSSQRRPLLLRFRLVILSKSWPTSQSLPL